MLSGGNGNFGAYGLLDFMTGTSIGRDVVEDMRAEAERKDLPGKAKRGYKQIRDRSEKQRNRK